MTTTTSASAKPDTNRSNGAGGGSKSKNHPSPADRAAKGKAARLKASRRSLATWAAASDRADPVEVLAGESQSRVQELVPIRYGRMLASPFAFYRGAATLMAADLSTSPTSGLTVQACGDAHLSNFGLFGSPERTLVFDINDFDETHPGPWEWDLKRLTASLAIAGRNNDFSEGQRREIVMAAAARYREAMATFAASSNLSVWYANGQIQEGLPQVRAALDKKGLAQAEKIIQKARSKDNLQALARLTQLVDGQRRIIHDPPLIVPLEELLEPEQAEPFSHQMHEMIRAYRRTLPDDRRHLLDDFEYVHLARKVVGVGSVGTRAWVILMLGRDDQDPLLLQAKEAGASVLEPFLGTSKYRQHGQRVVEGQRLMQATSDIFLGWQRTTGLDGVQRDFFFRQLRDWKGSWEPETMNPSVMSFYGTLCAWTLARAHARTGDRIAISSYLGASDTVDKALAEFAESYADQNESDFKQLQAAAASGRIVAEAGI